MAGLFLKEASSVYVVLLLLNWTTFTATQDSLPGSITEEVCRDQTLQASCKHGEVILIESALYGRMKHGTCTSVDAGLGCSEDVKDFISSRCSGKQSCEVFVTRSNEYFREKQPCATDYSWHLYLSYRCIPTHGSNDITCPKDHHALIEDLSGYVSSHVARTSKYGAGTEKCPYRITTKAGQKIEVLVKRFLLDKPCVNMYAKVIDGSKVSTINLCQPDNLINGRFVSTGHVIDIYFINLHNNPNIDYLLQFTVTGCPDVPPIPPGSHARRTGDSLKVQCNATGEKWFLTCSGNVWRGLGKNCTSIPTTQESWGIFSGRDFPYGIVIVVAVGVALGILFGGTTLLFISYRMKRDRHRYEKPPDACWNYEAGTIRRNSRTKVPDESTYTGTAPTRKQWSQGGHHVQTEYPGHNAPQQVGKQGVANNNKKVLIVPENKTVDYTHSSSHMYESPQADNNVDAFYG